MHQPDDALTIPNAEAEQLLSIRGNANKLKPHWSEDKQRLFYVHDIARTLVAALAQQNTNRVAVVNAYPTCAAQSIEPAVRQFYNDLRAAVAGALNDHAYRHYININWHHGLNSLCWNLRLAEPRLQTLLLDGDEAPFANYTNCAVARLAYLAGLAAKGHYTDDATFIPTRQDWPTDADSLTRTVRQVLATEMVSAFRAG